MDHKSVRVDWCLIWARVLAFVEACQSAHRAHELSASNATGVSTVFAGLAVAMGVDPIVAGSVIEV